MKQLLALTLLCTSIANADITLRVAPQGSLKTLTEARDAVRALKLIGPLPGPVKIVIAEGVYSLRETVVFSLEDSGMEVTRLAWFHFGVPRANGDLPRRFDLEKPALKILGTQRLTGVFDRLEGGDDEQRAKEMGGGIFSGGDGSSRAGCQLAGRSQHHQNRVACRLAGQCQGLLDYRAGAARQLSS